MTSDRNRTLWLLAGLTAGVATGLWLWRRGIRGGPELTGAARRDGDAASRILAAFAADGELAGRGLEVAAISDGVVELSGVVASRAQRERAVAVAHNTAGVHTVVNRLLLEREESRVEANRARNESRDSSLHHHGMGVGMGTRRQSPDTDPDRPSDRQKLVERELAPDNFEVEDDRPAPHEDGPVEGEPHGGEPVADDTVEEEPEA